MCESLCSIENVLLPSIGSANEDLTFVSLPNRKRILEEIANNIAERKHTFLTVSAFEFYFKDHIFWDQWVFSENIQQECEFFDDI